MHTDQKILHVKTLPQGTHPSCGTVLMFEFRGNVWEYLDCSQSPIFSRDRLDIARLTVNDGHLNFQMYRGGGRRGLYRGAAVQLGIIALGR